MHGDKGHSAAFAELVDLHDGRVVESRGESGLAAKTLQVGGAGVDEEFEGNRAIERLVVGLVDDAESAAAQALQDFVLVRGLDLGGLGQSARAEQVLRDGLIEDFLRPAHGPILVRPVGRHQAPFSYGCRIAWGP